jgi:hypothetical protein
LLTVFGLQLRSRFIVFFCFSIGFIGVILGVLCLEACTLSIATAWKNNGDFTQKQENETKIDSTDFKTNINKEKELKK